MKTTFRGLIEILEASESLRKRIGLQRMPHYSTLKKFADRSSVQEISNAMLLEIVQQFDGDSPEEAAIDSTGMETTSASAHYRTRNGKRRQKYVKLSVCVMAGSLLPSSVVASWGQHNDKAEASEVLAEAGTVIQPERLFADAEWVHEFCREQWQVESAIKPAVHRADGQQNGKYRLQMTEQTLDDKIYKRRLLVDSFMSGLTRTTGSALAAGTCGRNDSCGFNCARSGQPNAVVILANTPPAELS